MFFLFSGVACGIYTTNSAEACEYILQDSSSEIVVVENKEQLAKILKCKEKCKIKRIIQYKGEVADSHNGLVISVSSHETCFQLNFSKLILILVNLVERIHRFR